MPTERMWTHAADSTMQQLVQPTSREKGRCSAALDTTAVALYFFIVCRKLERPRVSCQVLCTIFSPLGKICSSGVPIDRTQRWLWGWGFWEPPGMSGSSPRCPPGCLHGACLLSVSMWWLSFFLSVCLSVGSLPKRDSVSYHMGQTEHSRGTRWWTSPQGQDTDQSDCFDFRAYIVQWTWDLGKQDWTIPSLLHLESLKNFRRHFRNGIISPHWR